ncbi:MAG: histidine kinase [Planctomycetes bacterium]|nr:histidine kinase [Planctomycetota bacterium]
MHRPRSPGRKALVVLGIWSVPALVGAVGRFLEWRMSGATGSVVATMIAGCLPWYTWAALTPAVLWAARRVPLLPPPRARALVFHALASVVVGHVYMSVGMTWTWVTGDLPLTRIYAQFMPIIFPLGLLGYWGIVLLASWLDATRSLTERTLAAARAESQLARARLDALQAQVNPHFLFNTLNSVSALVRTRDHERATSMIARLGALLRRTLAAEQRPELPLDTELELARDYLAIEQERLGDRLRVTFDVAPGLGAARVPNMLLQALVENAVLHGVAPVDVPCRVVVSARRVGESLVLRVENDGAQFGAGARDPEGGGLGLANARERLAQLHGDGATLDVEAVPGGGCVATVTLPFGATDDGASRRLVAGAALA